MQAATWLPRGGLARVVLFAAIAFFLLMIWWPISQTFWLSFWDQRPGVQRWVGLENYRTLLFVDTVFWKSLSVTFGRLLICAPGRSLGRMEGVSGRSECASHEPALLIPR